jgi:hypothetical protein
MYYSSTSNKYIPLNVCDKIDIKITVLLVAGLSQLSRVFFFLLCISLEFGYICHFSKNSAGRDGRRQRPKRWGVEPWKWRTCVKGDSWESERAFHCQTSEPLLATRQRFRLRRTVTYADRYMHVPRKKTQAVVLHATNMTWRHVLVATVTSFYAPYVSPGRSRCRLLCDADSAAAGVLSQHPSTCVCMYTTAGVAWKGGSVFFAGNDEPSDVLAPSPLPQVENRPTWKVALGWLGGTVIRASVCVFGQTQSMQKKQCSEASKTVVSITSNIYPEIS